SVANSRSVIDDSLLLVLFAPFVPFLERGGAALIVTESQDARRLEHQQTLVVPTKHLQVREIVIIERLPRELDGRCQGDVAYLRADALIRPETRRAAVRRIGTERP